MDESVVVMVSDANHRDMGVQPLAVITPNGFQAGTVNGGEGEEIFGPDEVLDWVLCQINEVSRLLGVTFEGHGLFQSIEATWRSNLPPRESKNTRNRNKLERELRKLECSILHGSSKEERGRGYLKSPVYQ